MAQASTLVPPGFPLERSLPQPMAHASQRVPHLLPIALFQIALHELQAQAWTLAPSMSLLLMDFCAQFHLKVRLFFPPFLAQRLEFRVHEEAVFVIPVLLVLLMFPVYFCLIRTKTKIRLFSFHLT